MLLVQFVFLQLCDLFTTLVFLRLGVSEANPAVRFVMGAVRAQPAVGLVALKLAALACGWYAWRSGRRRMLGRINGLFAVCVVWNVAAIVAQIT